MGEEGRLAGRGRGLPCGQAMGTLAGFTQGVATLRVREVALAAGFVTSGLVQGVAPVSP